MQLSKRKRVHVTSVSQGFLKAYIPILDIVETRDIILSNKICEVQRHGYAERSVLQLFA